MPVIRIDDEVWKWLQSKAEPLVDSPNAVLRRIAGLDKPKPQNEKAIEVELRNLHTPQTYALIPIPRDRRHFFPGYKVDFELITDIGVKIAHVTGGSKVTPIGDPAGGDFIVGGLRDWYDDHKELKVGDKLRIEALEQGKRYKLSVVKSGEPSV